MPRFYEEVNHDDTYEPLTWEGVEPLLSELEYIESHPVPLWGVDE